MFGMGMPELIVILVICLILFGAAKLPEIAKSLGKAMAEFKKSIKEETQDKELPPKVNSEEKQKEG